MTNFNPKDSEIDALRLAQKNSLAVINAAEQEIKALRTSQKELAEALAHCKSGLIQLADRNVHWYVNQSGEALRKYEEGNK